MTWQSTNPFSLRVEISLTFNNTESKSMEIKFPGWIKSRTSFGWIEIISFVLSAIILLSLVSFSLSISLLKIFTVSPSLNKIGFPLKGLVLIFEPSVSIMMGRFDFFNSSIVSSISSSLVWERLIRTKSTRWDFSLFKISVLIELDPIVAIILTMGVKSFLGLTYL